MLSTIASLSILSFAAAQQIGTATPEVHPPLTFEKCTLRGGCKTVTGSVTMDAGYRWAHDASFTTCNPNGFNTTICPDAATCSANCAIEGVDYATQGVRTSGNALTLDFSAGGPRVYLLDETGKKYENFKVMNQEFTFDVDVSNVPCAYNGALYFSEMPVDGALSATNKAGAAYGTGYCDSQCGTWSTWFNGTVNFDGTLGSCCNEMDLWEANSAATALTPHPCDVVGGASCTGTACTSLCDPDGCDFNPFRMGNHTFYGPSQTVDTTKPFTVVTQFVTNNGRPSGTLAAIKRLYVQNGRVIQNSRVNLAPLPKVNDITESFCEAKVNDISDDPRFVQRGGLTRMGQSLSRGAVLVVSLWADVAGGMTWLDGLLGDDPSVPGTLRGPCTPADVSSHPDASVTFSKFRVGDIGSTFHASRSSAHWRM